VLAGADLVRRGGLTIHPRLLRELEVSERTALLEPLAGRALRDMMTAEPRTIYVEASIPQAIGMLVEWGLDVLPAVDRAGRFAGIFGVEQALRAALEARTPTDGPVRDAEPPTIVRLVMQTAVPTVAANTPLVAALEQLLAAPARFLVVVEDGRPTGMLHDALIASRLRCCAHPSWVCRYRWNMAPNSTLATLWPRRHRSAPWRPRTRRSG
jgi:CBS domain-containing protein